MRLFVASIIAVATLLSTGCTREKSINISKWEIFESEIRNEKQYADPLRDVDLLLHVIKPDGSAFSHFGFYDGGNRWKFRIMPDMQGKWQYSAVFSDSSECISGSFTCVNSDKNGPLAVLNDNPYWFGYKNNPSKQVRSFHVGDRFFASNFPDADRTRFLNWIENQGYNMLSVASHYLNRQQPGRGEGWDTPVLWPLDPAEFDKLEFILADLDKRDIYVYPFAGFFGRTAEWPTDHKEQELYIRYTMARLAPFRNIILNVAGPEPILKPEEYQNGNMNREDINRIARLIKKYDPYGHPLSVHNRTSNEKKEPEMDPFIFESWGDYSTLQGSKSANPQAAYKFITSSRKVIKPVFAQEVLWYGNMYHNDLDTTALRKKAIALIMAGSFINFGDMNGNSSSGFSGCLNPDSASTDAHRVINRVWDTFDKLPFYRLSPRPGLAEGAFCLSDGTGNHLFYTHDGKSFTINIQLPVSAKWINPRKPYYSEPKTIKIAARNISPPTADDWLLWVESEKQARGF